MNACYVVNKHYKNVRVDGGGVVWRVATMQ